MKVKNIYIIVIIYLFICCTNNTQTDQTTINSVKERDNNYDRMIEDFEKNLKQVNLTFLKGLAIHFKSRGIRDNTIVYYVSKVNNNCSPYMAIYDIEKKNIVEIDNSLVIKTCDKDYIDSSSIKRGVHEYLKLEVYVLKVDTVGNIYINEYYQEKPNLLKIVNQNEKPSDMSEFKHYKDNWYLRK